MKGKLKEHLADFSDPGTERIAFDCYFVDVISVVTGDHFVFSF